MAHVGHEHFGRRRSGGLYGYGLDCPYDPYYTYDYPYNCAY
jgi:hypothetical protein